MKKRQKRVAIIGKGPGRGLGPTRKTKGTHIWGINNVWIGQYLDLIVDVHDLNWTEEECFENYRHLKEFYSDEELREKAAHRFKSFALTKEYANRYNVPIMSSRLYDDAPGFRYPLEKIIEKFDCDNFSSATPYAIAYAIYRKYTHIDMYGINCLFGEEWGLMRDAVVGWLMYAKAKGIKVTVSGQAGRPLKTWDGLLYGFNFPQQMKGVADKDGQHNLETGETTEHEVWREY